MKEGRRLGGVHAGPESKVLDGLSWEEVKNMQDAQTSQVDGYGGMKVNFLVFLGNLLSSFQIFLFFCIFNSSLIRISFDSSAEKSYGEGKCLKSNRTEAWKKVLRSASFGFKYFSFRLGRPARASSRGTSSTTRRCSSRRTPRIPSTA